MSWRIRGSYFESCNCEAICPCRRIDGVPGGRSSFGECLGLLSWMIEDGHADDVALDGLNVALATRYHDDEPGSPWSFVMCVDVRADAAQRDALEGIYSGRLEGDALKHFPWAWKSAERIAIRPVDFRGCPRAETSMVADPRPCERADPRPLSRQRNRDVHHSRPREQWRGARRGRATGQRRPPAVRVPRQLRIFLTLRLRRVVPRCEKGPAFGRHSRTLAHGRSLYTGRLACSS